MHGYLDVASVALGFEHAFDRVYVRGVAPRHVVLLAAVADLDVEYEVGVRNDGFPSVTVTGDMTHAGMVPVVADALPADAPGAYLTDDFAYDMAGDWVLTAEVTLDDGRRGFGETRVTVARP